MRRDGKEVQGAADFTALFPYIFRKRNESIIYYNLEADVESLMQYIEETKQFTFFQAVMIAMVKTLRQRPKMNRFIIGRKIYQRNYIEVSFVAKRELREDAEEVNVKLRFDEKDDAAGIIEKMTKNIRHAKVEGDSDDGAIIKVLMKLPRWMIRTFIWSMEWLDFHGIMPKDIEAADPLRGSVFMANLGSVGIDAPFHHLFEWGTISIFAAIGKIAKKPVVDENGQIVAKTMVNIMISLDERIADGYYYARSLDLFKSYLENPETIMQEENADV